MSDPLNLCFRWPSWNLRQRRCRTHPSGALGANSEAALGAAQFMLRTQKAVSAGRIADGGGLQL
eukprot:12235861-Alexandrium_andersonii.AAC.1